MNQLDQTLLETARRRAIYAGVEARLLSTTREDVRRAIQRLRKAGLIFRSENSIRNYYGSSDAGFRAVKN